MRPTPFYRYDLTLLEQTLKAASAAAREADATVHYAIKANANPQLLPMFRQYGFGIDCVSGGEVKLALESGFEPGQIVYAGVGKADWEIDLALENGIFCFNVESAEELDIIEGLAAALGRKARVCFRVNPDIDAHTHAGITTGRAEDKFGIDIDCLDNVVFKAVQSEWLEFEGLHFHIGSQILDFEPYRQLCTKANALLRHFEQLGIAVRTVNLGGGLGVDYVSPEQHPIPDFKSWFSLLHSKLELHQGQHLHVELGRSLVAQCGALITRVLYIKKGKTKQFAIVDASMTELIRPALYGAHHKIVKLQDPEQSIGLRESMGTAENVEFMADGQTADSGNEPVASCSNQSSIGLQKYDVVGPVCESSDTFGRDELLPELHRGDLLALQTAGAYGETMSSRYNQRPLPHSETVTP